MDRKTKVFFWILAIATVISVALIFNRAFVTKDYEIIEDIPEIGEF